MIERWFLVTWFAQIRRLEGLLRSPVFSDMSTLLSGLQTLRVYNQTDEFARKLL